MRLEDREEYVDMVAQAVIDRIEERDRLAALVDMVVHRVMGLQQQQAKLAAEAAALSAKDRLEETHDDGKHADPAGAGPIDPA